MTEKEKIELIEAILDGTVCDCEQCQELSWEDRFALNRLERRRNDDNIE
jgi:hypothetical protein